VQDVDMIEIHYDHNGRIGLLNTRDLVQSVQCVLGWGESAKYVGDDTITVNLVMGHTQGTHVSLLDLCSCWAFGPRVLGGAFMCNNLFSQVYFFIF
jgi:hypothetical protein